MPAPTDVSQLRAFLGLINFYGNFVKDLHDLRAPLDALTKKDAVYKWSPECKTSFNKIKATLSSDLLLDWRFEAGRGGGSSAIHKEEGIASLREVGARPASARAWGARILLQLRFHDQSRSVRQHEGFRAGGRSLSSYSVALVNTGRLRHRLRRRRCHCRVHRKLSTSSSICRIHPDRYESRSTEPRSDRLHEIRKMAQSQPRLSFMALL
ncbi:hypothetical protein COOONC_25410 [Cooperia oncophora]